MANRCRIKMSKSLFSGLTNFASQQGMDICNPEMPRFIKRLNSKDAELMRRAEVVSLVVTRQIRIVKIEWENEIFFCAFGLPEPEELPIGLEIINLTPGIFALSILEVNILPSATASEIRDAIESDYLAEGNGYEGHDLESITPLFPEAILYRSSTECDYHKFVERVLGSLLAKTYLDGPLQLEPETINRISDIFEGGASFIPYRNIVQGLLSICWENFFLETYRCLEQLYARPKVSALRDEWHSTLSLRELAALLETHLSWRPKEDEALSLLLCECDESIVNSACCSLGINIHYDQSNRSALAAREIYRLRNSIVHYRPIHKRINKSDTEWNEIVRDMLEIIADVYKKQGSDFFEPLVDLHLSNSAAS